jgi:hypothetical protein
MKIQITCTRCGFVAFEDRQAMAVEAAGWRIDQLPPRVSGISPACIGEEEPAPTAETKTA